MNRVPGAKVSPERRSPHARAVFAEGRHRRGVAIELHEISTPLSNRAQRCQRTSAALIHPLSNVRAWRQSGEHRYSPEYSPEKENYSPEKEYTGDLQRDALAAWRQFEALPADQAASVWRVVQVEIVALRRARQPTPAGT
jgi:hypothetical protein